MPRGHNRNPDIHHVRDSIREVNKNTWIVGEKMMLFRVPVTHGSHMWTGADGYGYLMKDSVPEALPESVPMTATDDFKKVHDLADASAVFKIGQAYLKIRERGDVDETPEHVTLNWLRQQNLSFNVPEVLFHARHNKRSYLVTTPIPGECILVLWPKWDETTRAHYANRLVEIIHELAALGPKGRAMTGVDGRPLTDALLSNPITDDCSTEATTKACEEIGMDCSNVVFYHCDIGTTNVFVDVDGDGSMNVIDWELAGWVPREWVRTKPLASHSFGLATPGQGMWIWARHLCAGLGKLGYPSLLGSYYRYSDAQFEELRRHKKETEERRQAEQKLPPTKE